MADTELKELYETNADFRRYVDRHCKMYGFTVEQALKQMLVRLVGRYYAEKE